ncbi:MAG: hypothetical protein JNJ49_12335 [Bdellovibrionaceae bacterium]|nr:hypothetical protein [Pseudobdellovibrionaceae bacterium]
MASLEGLSFINSVVKMPLMALPVRTVVVQTSDGNIMISPGSQLSSEQLQASGPITDIVAPNLFHGAGISKASIAHPKARLWGSSSMRRKSQSTPELKWTHELNENSWIFSNELPVVAIGGMPTVEEFVFVHKPSRSLIVTDLCFNLTDAKGFGAWLILSIFGTYRKFGISSFFLKGVKDRAAFMNSLTKLFSHDFDNIIVSHGDIVQGGAKALLRDALERRGFSDF